jgi:hypothetical protein
VLIVVFFFALAICLKWPLNGHGDNGDGDLEPNIKRIWLILEE